LSAANLVRVLKFIGHVAHVGRDALAERLHVGVEVIHVEDVVADELDRPLHDIECDRNEQVDYHKRAHLLEFVVDAAPLVLREPRLDGHVGQHSDECECQHLAHERHLEHVAVEVEAFHHSHNPVVNHLVGDLLEDRVALFGVNLDFGEAVSLVGLVEQLDLPLHLGVALKLHGRKIALAVLVGGLSLLHEQLLELQVLLLQTQIVHDRV